jgi:hypothetical protein
MSDALLQLRLVKVASPNGMLHVAAREKRTRSMCACAAQPNVAAECCHLNNPQTNVEHESYVGCLVGMPAATTTACLSIAQHNSAAKSDCDRLATSNPLTSRLQASRCKAVNTSVSAALACCRYTLTA